MKFNYSKLLGRIKECGLTQGTLAEAIRMSVGTMCAKLNNRNFFTQGDMIAICKVLNIPYKDIPLYLFAV